MPTMKTETTPQFDNPFTKGLDVLKPQAEVLQALYGEALAFAEARLRKQADFLHQLAASKDIPSALQVQTNFVQELWSDSTSDALKAFSLARTTLVPTT